MNWSRLLRAELASRARSWADGLRVPYYLSLGSEPTVLFEPAADGRSHGNFHPAAWAAIRADPEWSRRLSKPHSQRKALPEEKRSGAKELDSSNSSDALLMNCFCFPGAAQAVAGSLSMASGPVSFGVSPALRLKDGTGDATEIDMILGNTVVEAKLTEADFTTRPEDHVLRYAEIERCFDVQSLPRPSAGSIAGYQLIRNVLAADQLSAELVVLIDQRRPDLLQEWWRVHAAIRDVALRLRCRFCTWQEVSAACPTALRQFLDAKYGFYRGVSN